MEQPASPQITAFNCPNCGAAATHDSSRCAYCGSSLSVRICAACFGSVAIDMKHCPHCGAKVEEAQTDEKDSRRCPRCENALARITVGRHELRGCTHCGGLWVKDDIFQNICALEQEQEAVLEYKTPAAPPLEKKKPQRAYIPCPECGRLMNPKNFAGCSGVIIDRCRDHGSWFDREELHRIVTFIRDGGMRKAREREQLLLQDQKDRLRIKELEMAAARRSLDINDMNADRLDRPSGSDLLLQFLNRMFH